MAREKKRELPLFTLPIAPRALTFSPSPQPPYDTKRPLRRKEVWEPAGRNLALNTEKYKNLFIQAKSSRFLYVGKRQIMINILIKEFEFEIAS